MRLKLAVRPNPEFPVPRIVSLQFPVGIVGDNYSATVQIKGGRPPYRVETVGLRLPEGMRFGEDGRLLGKIKEIGDWYITIRVVDSLGQKSTEATVNLKTRQAAESPLLLGQFSPLTGVVGEPLEFRIPASGGVLPRSFELVGRLPPGVQFNSADGTLAGIPTTEGEWELETGVTDGSPEPSQAHGKLLIRILGKHQRTWLPWWIIAVVVLSAGAIAGVLVFRERLLATAKRGRASPHMDSDADDDDNGR